MSPSSSSRRRFLRLIPGLIAVLGVPVRLGARSSTDHPNPRPGIDGSRVLKPADLGGDNDLVELFDHVRAIPQIVDGIRCPCGCAGLPGNYSLLSCYEGGGMARYCDICQSAGRIAHERFSKGDSLSEIRRHIDGALG